MAKVVTLIQFNDAYHLDQGRSEPVGGAARFGGLIQKYADRNPLVLCSGDIFSPSLMSTVFRGKHMAEVVSALNTRVAVVGNHDFDLGLDQLIKLVHMMPNTKWLLSNVFDSRTNDILGGFSDRYILQHNGVKIGFIGLVETEWLATLSMDTSFVVAKQPVEVGTALAAKLREEGAEFVVALTHSRMPNDVLLAQQSTGIDLILGGHDHEAYHELVNNIHVAKSGTEFRYASLVTITLNEASVDNSVQAKPKVEYELVPVTSDVPEDPNIVAITKKFAQEMESKMKKPIAWVTHDIDARASFVRLNESDIGNLLTDIMKNEVDADFAILNAGTIRTDAIIPQGYFTMKDLFNLLPFEDLTCKTEITGEMLIAAMENGVSQWPKHEGRFPQISGFSFTFDPNKPPGSRVVELLVKGKPIDKKRTYTLACKPYISLSGKDGYDCFVGSKLLIPLEECLINSLSFSNYLRRLAVLQVWKHNMEHPHAAGDDSFDGTTTGDEAGSAGARANLKPEVGSSSPRKHGAHSALAQSAATSVTFTNSLLETPSSGPAIGKNWAKASIGPPRDPRKHHFQSVVRTVMDNLPRNLAIIDPQVEGRIKRLPLASELDSSNPA